MKPWRSYQCLNITSASTLDHQQWNFPLGIWHFAIASFLVAVVSLSKWELVRTGFSCMSSVPYWVPNVRLIDHNVLSSIYPAMNSSFFSSVMAVFDKGQTLVYTFIPSFIPNMILLKGFHIHVSL